jgi:hypothetical protein
MLRIMLSATLSVMLAACASAQTESATTSAALRGDNRLIGTWELVSTRIMRNDSTIIQGTAPEFRSLKILNGTHYSVITRRGDQFLRAGAGRYTLSSDNYTETVDLASPANFTPGAVYTFRISVEGDTWTLEGGAGATRLHEVWRRVR